jgi:serine/threonine-protein kinase
MGVVYRASHQVIARDVAIKFLHPRFTRDVTSRKRFLGEARAANQINHENIIDITDFGETEDGLVYLVMEYLQGRALDEEIAGRPMSPVRALRIAIQIAAGLGRAHELDVIHRDVKPGNVFLVRRRSEGDTVKLLDFGIARFERELRITDRGTLLGTPEYIAPEQVRTGEVSPHTDLYALGCVLFEMLVGEPPFRGSNMTEVLVKQLRDAPDAPSLRVPALTPELDALVLKMLHKDPVRRHRDAYHLVEDLRVQLEAAHEALSQRPPSAAESQHPPRSAPPPREPAVGALTVHMPSGRDDWQERVEQYRRRLNALHPAGDLPADIADGMRALEDIVTEAARLRAALHGSAQELTEKHDDVKATRLRIGRALDELASDESKLARAHEADLAQVNEADEHVTQNVSALLARPAITAIAHSRGQPLSEADAVNIQGLAMIIDKLRDTVTHARKYRQIRDQRHAALDDVRFQIEQLKGRMAGLNAATSAAQSEVEERVQDAESQLRGQMERLVVEAERVALYLRGRDGDGKAPASAGKKDLAEPAR